MVWRLATLKDSGGLLPLDEIIAFSIAFSKLLLEQPIKLRLSINHTIYFIVTLLSEIGNRGQVFNLHF